MPALELPRKRGRRRHRRACRGGVCARAAASVRMRCYSPCYSDSRLPPVRASDETHVAVSACFGVCKLRDPPRPVRRWWARLERNHAGTYSGQVVLAGAKGLYQGIVRASTPATVEMSLSCLCPAGPDGFGGTRYAQQSVSGTYAITALGGDRFELRQTSGTPDGPGGQIVVDTVERTP